MRRCLKQAEWFILTSVACAAAVLASACNRSEPPQTQSEPQATRQAASAAKVTEKPFASGGTIELQLDGGKYTVRQAADNAVRVSVSGNAGAAGVDVSTKDTHANVVVKDTPRNFEATIEVPQIADLVVRLTAGDLSVEAITGNKDIQSNAGNVDIVTGNSTDYASVDASVQAGDIKAEPFGESRSGLFPKLNWSGNGKYTLRARLIAGNLTLRSK